MADSKLVPTRELPPITTATNSRETLAHAEKYAKRKNFDEFLVVDIDAHVSEGMFWNEVTDRLQSDVWKYNAKSFSERGTALGLTNAEPGTLYQGVNGRIPHQERLGEAVEEKDVHKQITLARRAMDAMGIDYMSVFPTPMLQMGLHPQPEVEVELGWAYNRWLTEEVLPDEPRLMGLLYLPYNEPVQLERFVNEFAGKKGVIGFSVTSPRNRAIHHNSYMRLYSMLEERGMPMIFHAGFNWKDESMKLLNRFISMHALSFVHCNLIHMTNWIMNGLPERFPKLKVMWIESGLAWIPFIMQRLDSEYMMRTSEAPLLKRKPSEYIKEMYFSSQPIERDHLDLVESTFKAINAETQLLYASDWPHWDFDTPSTIYDLPFLNEKQKRNILGGNAARLFNLKDPYASKAAAE
jgi:predicted TIM-barrel fold metal-dependent hydrolase